MNSQFRKVNVYGIIGKCEGERAVDIGVRIILKYM
jgi:hypothetical protein